MRRFVLLALILVLLAPASASANEDQPADNSTNSQNKKSQIVEKHNSSGNIIEITPPETDEPKSTPEPLPIKPSDFCRKYPGKFGCPENKQ